MSPESGLSTSGITIMPTMDEAVSACSTQPADPLAHHEKPGYRLCPYVERFMDTEAGQIPVIKSTLEKGDLFSTFYVRCGIRRYRYTVSPGLYAVGEPNRDSEVLVTANFKLTFDHLRKALGTVDAWILVLDTKGINVWCAAGKGTFSTGELVNRIQSAGLEKVVAHKRVIVPQLGATGVSAKEVRRRSGFRVVYGPVRAVDIPAFLERGRKKDARMREVTFTMYERAVLTPVEMQMTLKPALITVLVLLAISGLGPGFFSFSTALQRGVMPVAALITGILSGALITPLLLPFIPVRAFALKGIIAGSLSALLLLGVLSSVITGTSAFLALFLFSVTVSSFLAMNFTGSTPFTSPSGVEKEMKRYIPIQMGCLVFSCGFWIYSAF